MLNNLTTKENIRIVSVSPENLAGAKGAGGMAKEGGLCNFLLVFDPETD